MQTKNEPRLDRRLFLTGATAASASMFCGPQFGIGQPAALQRIQRSATPLVLETPLEAFDRFLTPTDLFYIRNHFPTPTLNANTWRLRVEGAVERPVELSLEELRRMPTRTVPMTLECAGNSRAMLSPVVRGVQWGNGGISTAEWAGVSLIDVLNRAGLRPNAVDVVLEGADRGEIQAEPRTPGVVQYTRGMPLSKARQPNVLLAHRIGNADLPPNNGFPCRAIVPGWYGMASVKWVTRILVTDRPYNGYFQSLDYSIYERNQGLVTVTPLYEMQIKSIISSPTNMQRIDRNSDVRVRGVAWTGESEVTRVDISTDNGQRWTPARLLGDARPNCWRQWEFSWRTPAKPGRAVLMARATDARGNTQPLQRDADRRNYMINHVLPIEVEVR